MEPDYRITEPLRLEKTSETPKPNPAHFSMPQLHHTEPHPHSSGMVTPALCTACAGASPPFWERNFPWHTT